MTTSLQHAFIELYSKFKLHFYRQVFSRFETREASLSAVETFCVEVINALGCPTIGDFARFVNISPANATYRIQSLIKKGYVEKVRDEQDKRGYRLHLTERFDAYNRVNTDYMEEVVGRMEARFAPEELTTLMHILEVMNTELMPEVSRLPFTPHCRFEPTVIPSPSAALRVNSGAKPRSRGILGCEAADRRSEDPSTAVGRFATKDSSAEALPEAAPQLGMTMGCER
jgi:DNA-binding MarR family transcriptional regulator